MPAEFVVEMSSLDLEIFIASKRAKLSFVSTFAPGAKIGGTMASRGNI